MVSETFITELKSISVAIYFFKSVVDINLYKKYNFIEVGKREKYYQGIDGILMKKELM